MAARLPARLFPLFLLTLVCACNRSPDPAPQAPAAATPTATAPTALKADDAPLMAELQAILADHRKVIVLLAEESTLDEAGRQAANTAGQVLFHDKLERQARLGALLEQLATGGAADRHERLGSLLDYIESAPQLYDADRLAFREVLAGLQQSVSRDGSLPAVKLHKRIGEDLDALAEIERQYDREIAQIFSRFDARAIVQKREKWADYVAHLKTLHTREQLLKEQGIVLPYKPAQLPQEEAGEKEIFGRNLPAKTVVLTFDDGPHARYTNDIVAILKQYGVPAVFFDVGRNIGTVDAKGELKLGANAKIVRELIDQGYAVGNHSYTHSQLSKTSGDALKGEIGNADRLLKAADQRRSPLFRFPYGARNAEGLDALAGVQLRSVMWNIDSLDWADPVPSSIADRVLRAVDKEGRGIILFHDIHERTVKALPLVLDRLVADGYRFAGWDGSGFSAGEAAAKATRQTVTTGYADSWAVVIGVNDYAKWPKLQYAANDADGMRQLLVERYGFAPERVLSLKDGEATRNGILSLFERLGHGDVKKNDRVLVFFAGHGATRKLSSGREIGYIVPADADPQNTATDAIPMTEIQNIAEGLQAKHVFFVMDACYSGLGLTRGAGGGFLRENAKRVGRQMLTAGGADQLVADGGPGGHSIFSWTLLQGLGGKGDLNGDGLITATELAAYVAPAVSGVSLQTPAFGSLPGSEGGDFVFELPAETEFLNAETPQLAGDAIALNGKLDAVAPTLPLVEAGKTPVVPPVKVRDLQGGEQTIKPVPAVVGSVRQLAQRANDRGLQLYREKRYAEAEAQFTEALRLRPDFALAANNLGFVFYKQQKYAEAARWFENTIRADPSRAVAYLNLGDALRLSGQKEGAGKAYRTYLELAPNGPAAAQVRQHLADG